MVRKADADCPVEKRLNASCRCCELIGFLNFEILGPNVDATLMNLFKYSSRREGGNAGIKTELVGVMGKFIGELVPQAETPSELERQDRPNVIVVAMKKTLFQNNDRTDWNCSWDRTEGRDRQHMRWQNQQQSKGCHEYDGENTYTVPPWATLLESVC